MKDSVAVIGGGGFLGGHVIDQLVDRGYRTVCLDNFVVGRRDWVNAGAEIIYCDITHSETELRKLFEAQKFRYIFNYAAIPYVPVSYKRPLYVLDVNTRGAMMVINAAQDVGVERVIQISSAEVYGSAATGTFLHEDSPVRPRSSYGAAKAAIDFLIQCRWKEAGTPVIALRQFNCFGTRETHPYIIPEIIYQLRVHPGTVTLGNNSTRDFLWAPTAAWAAIELMTCGENGEVYNLGSGECISIYNLATLIHHTLGNNYPLAINPDEARRRRWELWHLQSDNRKIIEAIGKPLPVQQLRYGIDTMIEYYNCNPELLPHE